MEHFHYHVHKGMACLRIEPESHTKITAIYQFRIYFRNFVFIMQRICPYTCVSFDKYVILPSIEEKFVSTFYCR
jgi:hypothetical protein